MEHCGRSFKHFDTWFLFDNKGFYKREVKLGRCPKCLKVIIEINETRKSDDRIFTQYAEGKEAQKIEEFAIVIDTSMSCSGELVKKFLERAM